MADKIVLVDPTKPGQFKATGPTIVSNKIALSGLDGTGAALNDVIAFNGTNWIPSPAAPSADTASNLGAGAQSFKSKVGNDFQFRSIIGTGSNTVTQNANDITIAGAVITGSNLGAGNGVFSSKVANDLQFKSLVAGANISITPSGTDLTIALSGSAGAFTNSFTSAPQTITAAGALTLAHGLGSAPTLIQVRLKNISAELNYSLNDQVIINPGQTDSTAVGNLGLSMVANDATNITLRYGNSANVFKVHDKTSGVPTNIDQTKWQMIVKAWN